MREDITQKIYTIWSNLYKIQKQAVYIYYISDIYIDVLNWKQKQGSGLGSGLALVCLHIIFINYVTHLCLRFITYFSDKFVMYHNKVYIAY